MLAKQFEDRVESGGKILIEPALREAAAAVPGGKNLRACDGRVRAGCEESLTARGLCRVPGSD